MPRHTLRHRFLDIDDHMREIWGSVCCMAFDCKEPRKACHMPLYARKTRCRLEHTEHKIGSNVMYI